MKKQKKKLNKKIYCKSNMKCLYIFYSETSLIECLYVFFISVINFFLESFTFFSRLFLYTRTYAIL